MRLSYPRLARILLPVWRRDRPQVRDTVHIERQARPLTLADPLQPALSLSHDTRGSLPQTPPIVAAADRLHVHERCLPTSCIGPRDTGYK